MGDNMNKKGFTLVELLAVFTIISIIMLIGLPSITKNLKNNENKKYENFKETVILATETYIENNRDLYPLTTVGQTLTVTIGTLKSEGLIREVPEKPDGTKILDTTTVKVTVNSDKTLRYEFQG